MKKINIGVIGLGGIAEFRHLPSLKDLEKEGLVQIQGVCDINKQRLDYIGEKFDFKNKYTDYREMIKNIPLDGLLILSSPKYTLEIVSFAIREKKHLLLEKPPGMNLVEVKEIARLAEENKVKVMTAFNRRFSPLFRETRRRILEQGPITSFLAEFHKYELNNPPYYAADNWMVIDIIHHIDSMFFMGGELIGLSAFKKKIQSDFFNCFEVIMDFGQSQGSLRANYVSGARVEKFEIHGLGIAAYIDLPKESIIYAGNKHQPTVIKAIELTGCDEDYVNYGFYFENRHFIECIQTDRIPETSMEHSLKVMEAIEMVLK